MMEVFRILDDIEFMLKQGKKVPLSNGKVIIDASRFLEEIDRLKARMPGDLETARLIIIEKERIVSEACNEAETYVERSRDHAARLVDDNEITRNAMQMGEEMVTRAEEVAREIRRDADEYADGVLTHMEMVLKKGLEAISQGKDDIRQSQSRSDY